MTAAELATAVGGELLRPGRGGPVRSVALALDPPAEAPGEDVLVLHRSYELGATPPELAVVGTHDWFDAQLPGWLAAELGVLAPVLLLEDDPRALVGRIEPPGLAAQAGGADVGGAPDAGGLAGAAGFTGTAVVAGALTPRLVRAAAQAGAGLYVTGAWRERAADAVAEAGLRVVALGHAEWERRGIQVLAGILRARCGCPVRVLR